jgi:membrane dipeptidase
MQQSAQDPASRVFREAVIWDNHTCMPLRPGDTEFLDQLERHRSIGAALVVINVSFDLMPWHSTFKMLATFRSWIKAHPERYLLVATADDVRRAKREGRLGICFDIEGAAAVDDLPALVEPYYALGVRWMLIAYNRTNRAGGGCQENDPGLTEFGRLLIDEMERVGMIVDVSHTGHRTARDVFEYAKRPVNFSHSNPKAVWDHARNIPDDLIRACAATGGVVNINGIGLFLGQNDNTTETFVRHVDHVANIAGPDHVGIGLDYVFDTAELDEFIKNNPAMFPRELGYVSSPKLVEPERIPEIAEALLKSGWSEANLAGLLGGNNLRVAEQVWRR